MLIAQLWGSYKESTPAYFKGIDCFTVFCFTAAALTLGYQLSIGKQYFSTFLAALFATVGMGTLLINLRMQSKPYINVGPPRRPFVEFIIAAVLLLATCFHFLG